MPVEIVMPKLGLNMEEGLLVEWLKKEGQYVKKGEPLFVVETDKVTNEAEATVDGVLSRILIQAGEIVPVKTVIGLIAAEGEAEGGTQKPSIPAQAVPSSPAERPAAAGKPQEDAGSKVLASPVAKRIAKEHGVDLSLVRGSGPGGRIAQEDVERFIAEQQKGSSSTAAAATPEKSSTIPMSGVRAVIAERMTRSLQTAAQLTLHSEIDASSLVKMRNRLKAEGLGYGKSIPSYNAILMSVIASALKEHPRLNARLDGDHINVLSTINMGLAVDTEAGLLVVVVNQADQKSVDDIEKELGEKIDRALKGKSQPDDLTGGTFTMTNLGGLDIDFFTPIINPPEAAILGVGRIVEKLVIVDGKVTQQPRLNLSITFDHRLVDGAPAARFLQSVARNISDLK